MAEFTHLSEAATGPTVGWLTIFSSTSNWTQVDLNATTWTIRGTAQSGFAGWTVTVTAANAYTAGLATGPTGVVGSMDVRNAEDVLVATARGLGPLGVQARDLQTHPEALFAGNDSFVGSAGNDYFWGGTGIDTVSAGDGGDSLFVQSGVVDGGGGFDYYWGSGLPAANEPGVAISNVENISGRVVNVASSTTGVTITGGSGDYNSRYEAGDFITGGSGADHITTDWGADTIRTGLGDDYIDAGNPFHAQYFYLGGGRPVSISYTMDTLPDTLDLSASPRGATVDLTLTTAQNTGIGVKTLLGFEIMRGSAFNDTLSGASFVGGGSSTTSPVGAITIYGGAGDDRITGNLNNDLLSGEGGDDILTGGGGGADTLDGGAGFDIVDYTSRTGAVSVTLGASAQSTGDTFVSIEGVIGGAGNDTLSSSTAAGGSVFLAGGAGADMLYAAQYGDVLQGGSGNDTLVGASGADKFVLQLDGSVDTLYSVQGAQGDTLLLLDSQGAIVSGANGLLILDSVTSRLSWDADSDAGPIAPVVIAEFIDRSFNPEFRSIFAAGFQPSAFRTLNGNSQSTAVVYDWGAAAFEHTFTVYRPNGALERFDLYFDNGAKSNKFWDFNNTETWATRVADYDPQGRMTAYSVENDGGSSQVFQFDLDNTRTWDRLVESYDALGRLSAQAIKSDDGTASERYIDTYDTSPWAYYIDNYDALGRLLNHTFYNADGTVYG